MRVLVTGGRDYSDTETAYRFLDKLHSRIGVTTLIEGGARGADRIAGYWARSRGITNLKRHADWDRHGRAAGSIRNQQMLTQDKPDLVVAFPGGRGTAHMVSIARKAGVEVIEVGER